MANTNPIYKVTDTELTSIADAIREKTGLTVSLTYVDGFVSALSTYLASGKPYTFDNIINRDIVEIEGSTDATSIPSYCFYSYTKLKHVRSETFPNCTAVGSSAFAYCSNLETVDLPNCTSVHPFAFASCSKLTEVNLPNCILVSSVFMQCSNLTTINLPACSKVDGAFSYCYSLQSVNLSACNSIDRYAFYLCSSLTSINLPVCTYVGYYAFYSCLSLSSISLPVCTAAGQNAFQNCYNLQTMSLPECSYISASCFCSCYNLISLYLMSTSVVKLSNLNVFNSTPIGGYTVRTGGVYGSVYVPSSLVAAYQSASNWSAFSARIVGI